MGIKFYIYGVVSTACALSTLTYAVHTREQFYPTVVFLVTSKFSIVVLGNFGIFLTLMMGQLAKTLFLGQLRDQEREIMFDKARYTIFDTCLTLTVGLNALILHLSRKLVRGCSESHLKFIMFHVSLYNDRYSTKK
jgi:hypothetical protein